TKTADPLARAEFWQIFAALSLAAIGVDRVHHERRLHTHHRAIAAIGALDLASGKPMGDGAEPGAAIILGNRRAEQPKAAHLRQDLAIETLFEIVFGHPREQIVLRESPGGIAHELFVFGELAVEIERI